MNLREVLLRGIYAYGFEKPSAIQQRAIIPCIMGKLAVGVSRRISVSLSTAQCLVTSYWETGFISPSVVQLNFLSMMLVMVVGRRVGEVLVVLLINYLRLNESLAFKTCFGVTKTSKTVKELGIVS